MAAEYAARRHPSSLQVSKNETGSLVHQLSRALVRQHVRTMQDGSMGERLNRSDAHIGSKVEVGDAQFMPMVFEIRLEERVVLVIEGHILKPPGARDLLGEHAVKPRIETVRVDRDGDQPAYRVL